MLEILHSVIPSNRSQSKEYLDSFFFPVIAIGPATQVKYSSFFKFKQFKQIDYKDLKLANGKGVGGV